MTHHYITRRPAQDRNDDEHQQSWNPRITHYMLFARTASAWPLICNYFAVLVGRHAAISVVTFGCSRQSFGDQYAGG